MKFPSFHVICLVGFADNLEYTHGRHPPNMDHGNEENGIDIRSAFGAGESGHIEKPFGPAFLPQFVPT